MARFMIIDDDVELTDNTAAILRMHGHAVDTLNTTEDAVRQVTENMPDLLILDVMFPDSPVAGFDLARQIRHAKALKDMPILLLTSVNQEYPMDFSAEDIDADWMPVQDFMEKPVHVALLLEKVDRLLKKR